MFDIIVKLILLLIFYLCRVPLQKVNHDGIALQHRQKNAKQQRLNSAGNLMLQHLHCVSCCIRKILGFISVNDTPA
ncbi:hypothetical protein BROC_02341 [Candidatus Brocadiaceae bacterium]|nr:hypothetical protein BROC_02341 [Candidatus Brocadiaceae bacterium]